MATKNSKKGVSQALASDAVPISANPTGSPVFAAGDLVQHDDGQKGKVLRKLAMCDAYVVEGFGETVLGTVLRKVE